MVLLDGVVDSVEMLLDRGIEIDDDMSKYTPDQNEDEDEDEDGNIIEFTDCRPMIFDKKEHRQKRTIFDSFINHYIEYQPYINNIYNQCYPTGNIQVDKPLVGWIKAQAIRDKYYLDDVFFHLHMYVANVVMKSVKKYNDTDTGITISTSICNDHFANSSNTTFTLMKVLTDRLKDYLKPKKIELCYKIYCSNEGIERCSRCRTVYYCSLECQKIHWKKTHKFVCKPLSSLSLSS